MIINETLAKQYFPGVDPVGRRLKNGGPERPIGPNNKWHTIVGVVGDINYSGLDAPPEPVVYYRVPPGHDQQPVRRHQNVDESAIARARGQGGCRGPR